MLDIAGHLLCQFESFEIPLKWVLLDESMINADFHSTINESLFNFKATANPSNALLL